MSYLSVTGSHLHRRDLVPWPHLGALSPGSLSLPSSVPLSPIGLAPFFSPSDQLPLLLARAAGGCPSLTPLQSLILSLTPISSSPRSHLIHLRQPSSPGCPLLPHSRTGCLWPALVGGRGPGGLRSPQEMQPAPC